MCRILPPSKIPVLTPVVLLGMLIIPVLLSADTLAGRIQDAQGLAVANARVRLLDRNTGVQRNTVSAPDGSYTFEDIPAGTYVIEADAANSALIGSQEVSVRGEQALDLRLRIAAAQSEVLVTASGTPQTITEVAKAIDIVNAEEMNLRGVFQISEALRVLPGVQIQTQEATRLIALRIRASIRAAATRMDRLVPGNSSRPFNRLVISTVAPTRCRPGWTTVSAATTL